MGKWSIPLSGYKDTLTVVGIDKNYVEVDIPNREADGTVVVQGWIPKFEFEQGFATLSQIAVVLK